MKMPGKDSEINKTQRILSIYHLLTHCEETSMQEITGLLPGCNKTFTRDIALLKKAGVPVHYCAERRAFILKGSNRDTPSCAESGTESRFIRKINRLITIMDDAPAKDCDFWYMETIPGAARRTMQRDFAVLISIGYVIKYEREEFNSHDAGQDVPMNCYYCDRPSDTYDLKTFRRR
jgi:predicted DNA-binding transcriptional regulator YafY